MRGPRPRTPRLRAWMVGLACGLCLRPGAPAESPPPGGSSGSKADKARKDAEALALNAVNAGATAQAKAVPEAARQRRRVAPRTIKTQSDGPAVSAPVGTAASAPAPAARAAGRHGPGPAESAPRRARPAGRRPRAARDAIPDRSRGRGRRAGTRPRELVEQKLAELDPPVRYKPSISEVKAEFVRKDSRHRAVRPDAEQRKLSPTTARRRTSCTSSTMSKSPPIRCGNCARRSAVCGRAAGAGHARRGRAGRVPVPPRRRVDEGLPDELAGARRGRAGRRGRRALFVSSS